LKLTNHQYIYMERERELDYGAMYSTDRFRTMDRFFIIKV
jgi:hypothetical protein